MCGDVRDTTTLSAIIPRSAQLLAQLSILYPRISVCVCVCVCALFQPSLLITNACPTLPSPVIIYFSSSLSARHIPFNCFMLRASHLPVPSLVSQNSPAIYMKPRTWLKTNSMSFAPRISMFPDGRLALLYAVKVENVSFWLNSSEISYSRFAGHVPHKRWVI